MEAEPPDAEVLAEAAGERVGRRLGRKRRVEGGVEDRDVREVREQAPRLGDRGERGRVVERCELGQALQCGDDRVVEDRRLPETRPAVYDAVRDGRDLARRILERPERLGRFVGGDERELQARRAGVDDQDRAQ